MKRVFIMALCGLVFCSCNETPEPTPSIFNMEDFRALGGPLFPFGEELSLSASLVKMPMRNNWELVFYVDESEISRKSLNNSGPERVEFARFTPGAPGQYLGKACIVYGAEKVCMDRTFTVK